MVEYRLGAPQRAALFALMAEARELSNPELKSLWKLTLTGEYRRRLNELGLVSSRQDPKTRAFWNELTDRGWKWCNDELSGALPDRAGSYGGALYAVLAGLARSLERDRRTLADIFESGAAPLDLEARIRQAYRELAEEPKAWVSLTDLRPRLGDTPRAEVDATLVRLDGTSGVTIIPEENRKTLTAEDHAAAVRIGGEDNHLITMDRP